MVTSIIPDLKGMLVRRDLSHMCAGWVVTRSEVIHFTVGMVTKTRAGTVRADKGRVRVILQDPHDRERDFVSVMTYPQDFEARTARIWL